MAQPLRSIDVTIGSDMECFVRSKASGKIVSIEGKLGGTKTMPRPLEDLGDGYAVQEDNVMAEFNVPAATSCEDFVESFKKMRSWLDHNIDDHSIVIQASAELDDLELQTEQAQTFGCEPDFNAWLGFQKNNKPDTRYPNLRTCGGHVHVGWSNPTLEQRQFVVMWLDALLGLKSVWLDVDRKRRIMYGKAGACRKKSYGVEYRVLSNYWFESDELVADVYNTTLKAVELATKPDAQNMIDSLVKNFGKDIVNAINNVDIDLAKAAYNNIEAWLQG